MDTHESDESLRRSETINLTPEQIAAAQPSAEQIEKHFGRVANYRAASSKPLPGPALSAFCPATRVIFGAAMVPLCARHIAALCALGSPLLEGFRLGAEMAGADEDSRKELLAQALAVRSAPIDLACVLFVFSVPGPDLRRLLALPDGLKSLQKMAAERFFPKFGEHTNWDAVAGLVGAHYRAAFASKVSFTSTRKTTVVIEDGPSDGLGWLLAVMATMIREYGMSESEAWDELPLCQAWAYEAVFLLTLPFLEMESGYISQEAAP